ncbi:SYF2 splicing factor-domain-containing protein [Flammula alnicola]|nr:SYF2 splicing factor-domain-containing protein [Flammula alnicola]
MPAARSSKRGKKKGGKAAPQSAPPIEPETLAEDNVMQTDEPEPSASTSLVESATELVENAEKTVKHAAEVVREKLADVVEAAEEFVEEMTGIEESSGNSGDATPADNEVQAEEKEEIKKMTMEERKAKLEQLRKKMSASSRANRASLVEESAKAKITARDAARLERQRKLAETLRLKADAEERGEDVERQKNWEYTIEENEEWEKKLARKKRRADFEFHDDAHAARRRYKKDLDIIKPDLAAYNKQKAIAMGQSSGSLVGFNPTAGSSDLAVMSQEQKLAAENLYRDANTLIYGDSKPSEDAIDRVVSKINKDIDKKGKFSRKRLNEEEGDITYINEHNRVFNKKIARYYDKYTAEIRASFERGTAL